LIVIAACSLDASVAAAPTCDERVDAMVARVSTLAVNGRYRAAIVGVAATPDEPAPQTLWLITRSSAGPFELHTFGELVESSRSRLARDVDAALARRPLPIAFDVGSNDRVGEARVILRAISAHGPGYVLIHRDNQLEPDHGALSVAWRALYALVDRCDPRDDHRPMYWLDYHFVERIARAERRCGCAEVLPIEAAIDTIADRRGLFVMTYDRHDRSLGRFGDDDRFEDVIRAAEQLPVEVRRRGVRF